MAYGFWRGGTLWVCTLGLPCCVGDGVGKVKGKLGKFLEGTEFFGVRILLMSLYILI